MMYTAVVFEYEYEQSIVGGHGSAHPHQVCECYAVPSSYPGPPDGFKHAGTAAPQVANQERKSVVQQQQQHGREARRGILFLI